MKQFKDLGIDKKQNGFEGNKIEMYKVLNQDIVVHAFKIVNSKYEERGNGKCLHLQISIDETKYVLFTGSGVLMNTIEKIPEADFPFATKIISQGTGLNKRFEFS